MEHLLECDEEKDFNLVIAIQEPCVEVPEATRAIDELAKALKLKSTMENANAIWPSFFARPKGSPQNKVYHSTLSVAARRDRIVPLWVLVVGSDVQVFHLLVADFDPGLVPAFV